MENTIRDIMARFATSSPSTAANQDAGTHDDGTSREPEKVQQSAESQKN